MISKFYPSAILQVLPTLFFKKDLKQLTEIYLSQRRKLDTEQTQNKGILDVGK